MRSSQMKNDTDDANNAIKKTNISNNLELSTTSPPQFTMSSLSVSNSNRNSISSLLFEQELKNADHQWSGCQESPVSDISSITSISSRSLDANDSIAGNKTKLTNTVLSPSENIKRGYVVVEDFIDEIKPPGDLVIESPSKLETIFEDLILDTPPRQPSELSIQSTNRRSFSPQKVNFKDETYPMMTTPPDLEKVLLLKSRSFDLLKNSSQSELSNEENE